MDEQHPTRRPVDFVIIAPSAGGNCFDATRERSGERDAITKMVDVLFVTA